MKYFMVEGTIRTEKTWTTPLCSSILLIHKRLWAGEGLGLRLKADMSGGIFLLKAETVEQAEEYLAKEPFKLHGIQDYR